MSTSKSEGWIFSPSPAPDIKQEDPPPVDEQEHPTDMHGQKLVPVTGASRICHDFLNLPLGICRSVLPGHEPEPRSEGEDPNSPELHNSLADLANARGRLGEANDLLMCAFTIEAIPWSEEIKKCQSIIKELKNTPATLIRLDRFWKDFLAKVEADFPGFGRSLEGSIEDINRAVETASEELTCLTYGATRYVSPTETGDT